MDPYNPAFLTTQERIEGANGKELVTWLQTMGFKKLVWIWWSIVVYLNLSRSTLLISIFSLKRCSLSNSSSCVKDRCFGWSFLLGHIVHKKCHANKVVSIVEESPKNMPYLQVYRGVVERLSFTDRYFTASSNIWFICVFLGVSESYCPVSFA